VTHGVGVHLLPCLDAERDPDLVRVGPYFTEEARQLWVLTLDELRTNSRVRAFMDHAAASLAGRS
jgi:DNA-binding transcriptional LysR family regulator